MCLPLMAEGEIALVKDHLETAGKIPVSSLGFLMNETERYFLLVDLAVQERDEVGLRQYAPLAEEMALRDEHLLFQAGSHRAWGVLHRLEGKYEKAEARLNQALEMFQGLETRWQIGRTLQALEMFQGLETRWQIGRTLYELAELAVARADPTEAREYFSRALVAFEEIRANPDAVRTREALRLLD
jgi:tetratricopeptide (TPR) repeat protein